MGNWITVVAGALLTIAPQIIGVIPHQYADVLSGVLAAATAAWHLYQPPPTPPVSPTPPGVQGKQ